MNEKEENFGTMINKENKIMTWTKERVDLLVVLWEKGLSATNIAKQIGKIGMSISRNAVIGKARRLDLKRRPSPIKPKKEQKPPFTSILDLKDMQCIWPYGDPQQEDFHFCGKEIERGFSYCKEHVLRAYRQSKKTTRS